MGEQHFICPNCDHLDVILGECPECGTNMTKLSADGDSDSEELNDSFNYSTENDPLEDFDDSEEGLEPHEGGLGSHYY